MTEKPLNEERTMILQMLKDGAINVEEAERLLEAVDQERSSAAARQRNDFDPKYLHVQQTIAGRPTTNVRIPFSLVRVGLKLGKTFIGIGAAFAEDEQEKQAMQMLKDIDFDEIIASLDDGTITLPYVLADVFDEAKDEHTEVVIK